MQGVDLLALIGQNSFVFCSRFVINFAAIFNRNNLIRFIKIGAL